MVIEPVRDFYSLRGSLKTDKKPLTNDELHEVVAQAISDEYSKKIKRTG